MTHRIGYFTPTHRGQLWLRNRSTSWRDLQFCGVNGIEWVDLAEQIAPSNFIEVSRNQAITRAIDSGCTHLFMLDSDVAVRPPESPLAELWLVQQDHGATAVGGAVPVRGSRKSNAWPERPGEVYKGEAVAAACMLIDLPALRTLPKPESEPWFKRCCNAAMTMVDVDEGVFFCMQLTKYGGTVWVHHSMQTEHQSESVLSSTDATVGDNRPDGTEEPQSSPGDDSPPKRSEDK